MLNVAIAPTLQEIEAMSERVASRVSVSPLLRFHDPATGTTVGLKLESLQRIGAFKIRPAAALMLSLSPGERAAGVCTASSGNFGIAVAALAAELGVAATVVVPHGAPMVKLDRLRRHGARVVEVSQDAWWQAITTRRHPGVDGTYLDAVADTRAQAGSGVIGLELLEQMPEVDTVFVPFGGGGLLCGVAAAIKALRPHVRFIACESELATPLHAARAAGGPVDVACRAGFVSGIGAATVLREMWPLLQRFVDDVVVSLAEIVQAIRVLALDGHVVAEGAGAAAYAAACCGRVAARNPVCIISGGNIGANALATVFSGGIPRA